MFATISLSAVHGDTNNSSYIYSDNLSSNNSDNKTSYNDTSDNKTSYNDTSDNNHNQTTIDKSEENETIVQDKKEPISNTPTKSRVVIRKYVKPKNTPGFGGMVMVFAIIMVIIYMSTKRYK